MADGAPMRALLSFRHVRAVALVLGVSVLAACGGGSKPATAPTPAASSSAPAAVSADVPAEKAKSEPRDGSAKTDAAEPQPLGAIPPTVKLLDPGAAPRRPLRHVYKAGVTERAEMDIKMALDMGMGAAPSEKKTLPTMRTVLRLDATEVTAEGDLRAAFEAERVEVLKDMKLDAKMRTLLEKELLGLVGMRGKARVSPRGIVSESDFELPPNASSSLKTQMDSLRDAIQQMYFPLPEEEIGKGGKWEVTSRVPAGGALIDSKATYTVTALDPDSFQVDVSVALVAPPNQKMSPKGMPPGTTATLDSMTGTSAGKATCPLTRLIGTAVVQANTETLTTIASEATSAKTQIHVLMDLTVAVRPTKAPAKKK